MRFPTLARRPAAPIALAVVAGVAIAPLLPPWLPALLAFAVVLALPRTRARVPLLLLGVAGLAGLHATRPAPRIETEPGPRVLLGELTWEAVEELPGGGVAVTVMSGGLRVRLETPQPLPAAALPGARLQAVGQLASWRPAVDPGAFDASQAARRRGLAARFRASSVRVLSPGRGPGAWLAATEVHVRRTLRDAGLPDRELTILRAVVLGDRAQLAPDLREDFRRSGAVHLLSLSGLHVGVVAALALALVRPFSSIDRRGLLLAVLVLYLLIAGARIPTLRATVAGLLFLLAPGRGDAWNRLAVALVVALGWDPGALWDVGLQLSFGTVAGLIVAGNLVVRAGPEAGTLAALHARRRTAPMVWARRLGIGALAAFLASTPLLALRLGQLPLVALLVGPPAIALFSLALVTGVVAAVVCVPAPGAGAFLFGLAGRPLALLLNLIEAAGRLDGGYLDVLPPHPGCAVAGLGALLLVAVRWEGSRSFPWRAAWLGVVLAGALVLPRPHLGDPPPLLLVRRSGRAVLLGGPARAEAWGRPGTARWLRRAKQDLGYPDVHWVRRGPALVLLEEGGARVLVVDSASRRELRTALAATSPQALARIDVVVIPTRGLPRPDLEHLLRVVSPRLVIAHPAHAGWIARGGLPALALGAIDIELRPHLTLRRF
jgi:ComEC/Rec2-related protein